jgi:Holliday junction resolvase RusA-like endonuclease
MTELRIYTVPGVPVAWARAVPTKNHMFDSQKKIKLFYGITIGNQHTGDMYTGPLLLDVTFYFPLPMTKKKQWDALRGTPHYYKPDSSNCIKFLEDAITGVLIHDDCIIADTNSRKRWADEGKTVFKLIKI